jgi:hypothetical protein
MKKLIIFILITYIIASCIFSIGHAISNNPWEFRQYRNGLLCIEINKEGLFIYSPFCNYADVYILGIGHDEEGWYTFSDGFYEFGQWKV